MTEMSIDYKQIEFEKWFAKKKYCPCRCRDMWRENDCNATSDKCSMELCPFYYWIPV